MLSTVSLLGLLCLLCLLSCSAENFNAIIVIYGQLRTFPLTCGAMFQNVIQQNAPCKIIINIDGGDNERTFLADNMQVRSCLQMYEGSIDYIIEGIHKKTALHHGMEFDLMDRAMDHIEAKQYTANYLLKLRTDNFINAPLDIATAFGNSSSFVNKFMAFQHQYAKLVPPSSLDGSFKLADHLWPWVFTAGVSQLIRPMFLEPSPSPWSFLNATAWNQDMKHYIYTTYSEVLPASTTTEFYSYHALVQQALADIHSRFQVAYVLGRTWVHFGRFQTIARLSRGIVHDYGYMSWNVSTSQQTILPPGYQWPFTGAQLAGEGHRYDIFEWREVTESQFRLEHWKQGVNLVDMQNVPDDVRSFTAMPGSVWEDVVDERLVAFILRTCAMQTTRGECVGKHLRHRR
jgi:hypothetical protein